MNCVIFVVLTFVTLAVSLKDPDEFETLGKESDEYFPIRRRFLQDNPANIQSSPKPVEKPEKENKAETLPAEKQAKPVVNSDEEDEAVTVRTKEKLVEKSEEEDEPVTTTAVKKEDGDEDVGLEFVPTAFPVADEEIPISTTEEDFSKFFPVLKQENGGSTSSDVKLNMTFKESNQDGKKCSLVLTKGGKVKSFKCHQDKIQKNDISAVHPSS